MSNRNSENGSANKIGNKNIYVPVFYWIEIGFKEALPMHMNCLKNF
jgi:hypothetical protein